MDIQLHFTEQGCGEPLICLHGNGEDGTMLAPQVERFSEHFRTIAVDTRGHGATLRGTAPFTLEQFAADLAGFMDAQGIEAAHLLGFSDGANIAMLFALSSPERVKSMVLCGGNLFPEGLVDEVRREDAVALREAISAHDEHQVELLRLMTDEPRIDPADLGRLCMPVLVVAGTDDMIAEEHTRLIAQSIPGAQLRILPGSHFLPYEDPDAFNDVVARFLSQVGGAAAMRV